MKGIDDMRWLSAKGAFAPTEPEINISSHRPRKR